MSEILVNLSAGTSMTGRSLRTALRTVDALIMSFMMPVILMLVFVYLFGGAFEVGGKYVDYVVPGVLIMCAGFAATQTAVSVAQDKNSGIVDRFRSMDVSGVSFLSGHVATSLARSIISTTVVFAVAFAIGFRPDAQWTNWLTIVGVVLMYTLAMSWVSTLIGLLLKSVEGATGFTTFAMFLPYPSSAFVPVATMPGWIQGFAGHQPVTPIIETMRTSFAGHTSMADVTSAALWCAGTVVLSVIGSAVMINRRH